MKYNATWAKSPTAIFRLIQCNVHTSFKHKHENYDECTLICLNFDAVYQGGSKFAHENRKTQTAHIGYISDERNPPSNVSH